MLPEDPEEAAPVEMETLPPAPSEEGSEELPAVKTRLPPAPDEP